MFFGFTSFTYADAAATATTSRTGDPGAVRGRRRRRSTPRHYEVEQVFYPSKDGTRVPMFLVHRKGLPRDGARPDAALRLRRLQHQPHPGVRPVRASCWLERGGVVRRGQPARRRRVRRGLAPGRACSSSKQNVFDDFIAAAEWLVASGYTRAREAGHPGRQQRRPAGGRGDDAAARAVRRRGLPGAGGGHAALPPVHGRPLLDPGVRLRRRPGAVPVPARLLAVPQREGRRRATRRR